MAAQEEGMSNFVVTRRRILTTALATTALTVPFVRRAQAATSVAPKGKMTLAWH